MYPRFTLTAMAITSLFSSPVFAASTKDEATVIVTATRQPARHNELLNDSSALTRDQLDSAAPLETLGDYVFVLLLIQLKKKMMKMMILMN